MAMLNFAALDDLFYHARLAGDIDTQAALPLQAGCDQPMKVYNSWMPSVPAPRSLERFPRRGSSSSECALREC